MATRLARRHGLRLHSTDTRTWVHRDRALAAGSDAAARWEPLAPDERWALPTDELLELSLHGARGAMVLDDVRALPPAPLTVAEGSSVPASAADDPARALWLLPSAELQEARLAGRPLLDGHRRLYRRLRDVVEAEARAAGVPVLVVDGTADVAELSGTVEAHFAAAIEAGPVAGSVEERRSLLREANLAVVGQVRGYHGRAGAAGEAEAVVQPFLCECGRPTCVGEIGATVAVAAAGPLIAPGHPRPR